MDNSRQPLTIAKIFKEKLAQIWELVGKLEEKPAILKQLRLQIEILRKSMPGIEQLTQEVKILNGVVARLRKEKNKDSKTILREQDSKIIRELQQENRQLKKDLLSVQEQFNTLQKEYNRLKNVSIRFKQALTQKSETQMPAEQVQDTETLNLAETKIKQLKKLSLRAKSLSDTNSLKVEESDSNRNILGNSSISSCFRSILLSNY